MSPRKRTAKKKPRFPLTKQERHTLWTLLALAALSCLGLWIYR